MEDGIQNVKHQIADIEKSRGVSSRRCRKRTGGECEVAELEDMEHTWLTADKIVSGLDLPTMSDKQGITQMEKKSSRKSSSGRHKLRVTENPPQLSEISAKSANNGGDGNQVLDEPADRHVGGA